MATRLVSGHGIYMAASKNHGEFVAHAHILLVGFVVSFIYGLIHKLWLGTTKRTVAAVQFYLHRASTLVMAIGLLLFYGGLFQDVLDPILAMSAFGVLGGAFANDLSGHLVASAADLDTRGHFVTTRAGAQQVIPADRPLVASCPAAGG